VAFKKDSARQGLVLQCRRDRGLILSVIEHPLMTMPLGRVMDLADAGAQDDDLLRRVMDRARQLYSLDGLFEDSAYV